MSLRLPHRVQCEWGLSVCHINRQTTAHTPSIECHHLTNHLTFAVVFSCQPLWLKKEILLASSRFFFRKLASHWTGRRFVTTSILSSVHWTNQKRTGLFARRDFHQMGKSVRSLVFTQYLTEMNIYSTKTDWDLSSPFVIKNDGCLFMGKSLLPLWGKCQKEIDFQWVVAPLVFSDKRMGCLHFIWIHQDCLDTGKIHTFPVLD